MNASILVADNSENKSLKLPSNSFYSFQSQHSVQMVKEEGQARKSLPKIVINNTERNERPNCKPRYAAKVSSIYANTPESNL